MAARRSWSAEVAACGALGLPIVVAMAAHGGFFARGQLAFAAVGVGMALAVIALVQPPDGALRNPALLALGALAALSAVSAIWTIAPAEDALRWSAVIAALFLLGIASAAVATRIGALPLAATIALFAAGAGLVGLYGAGARVEPLAQRLGGQWSAGGPLEYSPALALLQVSALPALMLGMGGRGVRLAFASAMGTAIAGSILALSGSRVELALAVAVAAVCAATAQRTLGLPVAKVVAAVALAATAGGAADAVAGSYVRAYVTGDDGPRLVGLAAIVLAAGGLWLLQRRALARVSGRRGRALALGLILVPLACSLTAAALTPDSGPQTEPVSGFTHGRLSQWRAAVETAAERPLAGWGSQSFYLASLPHQDPPPVRFAHNLPLETWAELGAGGVLAVALLYGGSVRLVWTRRGSPAAWLLGPAALGFLIANLFDWPWHIPASGAVFALALGGLAASPRGASAGVPRSPGIDAP